MKVCCELLNVIHMSIIMQVIEYRKMVILSGYRLFSPFITHSPHNYWDS
jgi:hypothetical protein